MSSPAALAIAQDNETISEKLALVDDHDVEGEGTNSVSDNESAVGYCGDPACSIANCAAQLASTHEETVCLILYTKPVSNLQRYKFGTLLTLRGAAPDRSQVVDYL